MCRTTDYDPNYLIHHHHVNNHRLKLTNFTVNFSLSTVSSSVYLPETLTLVFLPRINSSRLEINGDKVRPDSPAFLNLHRTLSPSSSDVVFSSKDCLILSDGAKFEVHVGEIKLLKGVFREDEDGVEWRLQCRCMVEEREFVGVRLKDVEVCVGDKKEGVLMREKVVVERRRKTKGFKMGLEEIPEERECDVEEREDDVEDDVEGEDDVEMTESEMDGVSWTVDVGIWVACLGLGLLVSSASVRSLWRRKLPL